VPECRQLGLVGASLIPAGGRGPLIQEAYP